MPGAPLHGGTKLHEYLYSKSDSRMDDRQKIIGGRREAELTTVDGQKIRRGATKVDLTTVDGQKKPGRGAKESGERKNKKRLP